MKSSVSTNEPSRTSPFVLGHSGQSFDFSSGPPPFIGGPPLDPIFACTGAQNCSLFLLVNGIRNQNSEVYYHNHYQGCTFKKILPKRLLEHTQTYFVITSLISYLFRFFFFWNYTTMQNTVGDFRLRINLQLRIALQ